MTTLGPDSLVLRGGEMARKNLEAHLAKVRKECGRPGVCLKVVTDAQADIDTMVGHNQVCLTTPALLEESGIDPDLDPTHDEGDIYHHTLWLPDQDADTLVAALWRAFRGPMQKGGVSRDWTTDDLRGLQHPGA